MELNYPVLMRKILNKELETDRLWVEDINGIKWFWKDGNFITGMKNGDKEPPYIYLTDKYNISELYLMKFKLSEMVNPKRQSNRYTVEDIITKFSNSNKNIHLVDSKGDVWDFIPLAKSIINTNGESITEFYDEISLSMKDFEVMWEEESLPKTEIKETTLDNINYTIKNIESELTQLKTLVNLLKNTN